MLKTLLRIFLTAILLPIVSGAVAQSYAESALLFSRTVPGGSARVQGFGGAQIAIGGDYSSGLSNPAGLGLYNRSEFTFSPGLNFYNTKADYLGNADDESTSRFNIPGLSLVFNMPKEGSTSGFLGGSFSVSLSRINDFNRSVVYRGVNTDNSIIDYFIDRANGATTAQFDEDGPQYNTPTGLAYFNYLIGPQSILPTPGPNNEYFTDVSEIPTQQEEIITKGAANQWSFSYGANFSDMVFVGGGIGLTTLRYKTNKTFSESFTSDIFNSLQLNETLQIKGSGINATIGAIVRPASFVQIGVSFVSPTYYSITERYNASLSTSWNNYDYYGDGTAVLNEESASTDDVVSEYSLTTPLKLSAGIAFISKLGFLTADIEMTNPGKAKYGSNVDGISFRPENDEIKASYQSVLNYRVGAEFRYKIFRARGGFGVQANTYKSEFDIDNKITSISGGVGVRMDTFFIDFAWVNSSFKNYYAPYTFSDGTGPTVGLKNKTTAGVITVGLTF